VRLGNLALVSGHDRVRRLGKRHPVMGSVARASAANGWDGRSRTASTAWPVVRGAEFAGASPGIAVGLQERPWFNEGLNDRWFFIPGVIGTLTLLQVVSLTAFAVVREREVGTLEQIMVSPIRPIEFILGKTVPFFLIGLGDVTLIRSSGCCGSTFLSSGTRS